MGPLFMSKYWNYVCFPSYVVLCCSVYCWTKCHLKHMYLQILFRDISPEFITDSLQYSALLLSVWCSVISMDECWPHQQVDNINLNRIKTITKLHLISILMSSAFRPFSCFTMWLTSWSLQWLINLFPVVPWIDVYGGAVCVALLELGLEHSLFH